MDRFTAVMRNVDPECMIYIEDEPDRNPRVKKLDHLKPVVNAAHWYDVMTLLSKRYLDWFTLDKDKRCAVIGKKNIERAFNRQLKALKDSARSMGGIPTLLGEFGVPFDMHGKKAYQNGDYSQQIKALDRSYRGVEANLLDSTLWNYTADNTNLRGDKWNDEDFSIFSPDQQHDPASLNSGGRALEACVRPYPMVTAGTPLHLSFNYRNGFLRYEYLGNDKDGSTELFIPSIQYPNGIEVVLSDGSYEYKPEEQRLILHSMKTFKKHSILIKRK